MNTRRYPELAALSANASLRQAYGLRPMGECERELLAQHYAAVFRRRSVIRDMQRWLPRIVAATHGVLGF